MLNLKPVRSQHFTELIRHTTEIENTIFATAAAVYIIHDDHIVHEWYCGTHDSSANSRPVDSQSRFNVGSILLASVGSFQSLGITGCAFLVIPEHHTAAD